MEVKIITLNARGLGQSLQRRRVFRYLKMQKPDICFLQETHCIKENEYFWGQEWGNKCMFSNGSSNARGVGILLGSWVSKVEEVRCDMSGRYILCKINIAEYSYCIANIYAPNTDDVNFFNYIFNQIRDMDCVYVIVGSDFNVALNSKMDRSAYVEYNTGNRERIIQEIQEKNLIDVYREKHPEKKVFTWMRGTNRREWSRIDYFLISSGLLQYCDMCEIFPSVISDHSLVMMRIVPCAQKRGPGCWKLNNELLLNERFCTEMKNCLEGVKRVYSYLNDIELSELLKYEASQFTREFAKQIAYDTKWAKFNLYEQLEKLQRELINDGLSDILMDRTKVIESEITSYEIQDAKRAAFRCHTQFTQYGEIPSKYYFNLEKRNYVNKTMYVARKPDNSLT